MLSGPMADSKLNNKQTAFVLAYIGPDRFNATKAAITAGYSEKSASSLGYQLLQNHSISARIKQELEARAMSADAVLAELADVASAEWRDFLQIRTHPVTGEIVDAKMDLRSKVDALELLGKHHQLFTDKLHVTGEITFADLADLAGETDAGTGEVDPPESAD